MIRSILVTDCEGPISKNDNAFELTENFIPDGAKLFGVISQYDDVLAYLKKKKGYSAGYTLKLVAPFLKAYGVTNKTIMDYSKNHILLIEDIQETLKIISKLLPTYILSTSYEQYIDVLCTAIRFPIANTFSTHLDLDQFELSGSEVKKLKMLKEQIVQLPSIEIPEGTKSIKDLPSEMKIAIETLDEIFFSELPTLKAGKFLENVHPIGSKEKAETLVMLSKKLETSLDNFMYVGDSITDFDTFQTIHKAKGLPVSFNGNQYAIQKADLAILSKSALSIALVAEVFTRHGRKGVFNLADNWPQAIRYLASKKIGDYILALTELPQIKKITSQNISQIIVESNTFRKTVRGRTIGSLG